MRFHIHQPARARDRRMIRRPLVQPNPDELPDRQRVSCSPRDPSLAIDPFEVPYQQQAEIDSRSQTRASHRRCIEALAFPLHKPIKIVSREKLVQALIEGMACRTRQLAARNPNVFLLFSPRAHRHMAILQSNILRENCFLTLTPDCWALVLGFRRHSHFLLKFGDGSGGFSSRLVLRSQSLLFFASHVIIPDEIFRSLVVEIR